jgi:hypothetical protein
VSYLAGEGVHRVDRSEDLVATRSQLCGQALAHQPMALGDQRRVPGPTVLVVEGDQFAARRNPGGAAGLGEQHQRQQPGHLTVLRREALGVGPRAGAVKGCHGCDTGVIERTRAHHGPFH